MAREKVGDVVLKVRVSDEVAAALDGLGVNRSEWVREACEMRLAGLLPVRDVCAEPEARQEVAPKSEVRKVVTRKPAGRDWSADFPAVEAVLGEHRYSVPALAKRLGWNEMRLERVLNAMEAAGKVRFDRGAVVPA